MSHRACHSARSKPSHTRTCNMSPLMHVSRKRRRRGLVSVSARSRGRLRQVPKRAHLTLVQYDRRRGGPDVLVNTSEQNGVIAFGVSGIRCTFERSGTVAQPRTAAQSHFKLVFPLRKLVGVRAREVLRQLAL